MDKNESLTPQEKKGGDRSKLPVFSLATAVLFVADLYIMINLPKNYPALVIVTVLFLASVYCAVNMVLQEIEKSKMQEQEQHDALLKSGKANYIQTKKVMDQIADIGNQTVIPGDDIITAQKALAKVTITRNKENTDALMNSNDQVLEKLYDFEEKMGESQSELLNRQRSIMDDTVREFSEKQQEITARVAGLETSLKEELLQVTSFLHEIEEKVSQPVYIQPQAVPTAAEAPESVIETGLDAQIPLADETDFGGEIDIGEEIGLRGDIDLGEETVLSGEIDLGEEISLDEDINFGEDIDLDGEIDLGEEISLDEDINFGEDIDLGGEIDLGEEISLDEDINFGEDIDLDGEIDLGEEISLDREIDLGEEIGLDGEIGLGEEISLDEEEIHSEAEMFPEEEIALDNLSAEEPILAEVLLPESDNLSVEEMKEVIGETVMTAPVKEPEPVAEEPEPQPIKKEAPDLSNPNKMLTPDEIAALIANM